MSICNQEETQRRISFCVECDKNYLDIVPKCKYCNCSISILTSLEEKSCPEEKW